MDSNGVVLGVDVGDQRIGLARGDIATKIASPLAALVGPSASPQQVVELAQSIAAKAIVVGLPRSSQGNETQQSQISRQFAADLSQLTKIVIVFQDESLTSVEAENRLRRRSNFQASFLRDGQLDSEAAVLILTDYLEGIRP
jgi:putative Holliday junction resolvase